jgi:hypothetical protein
VQTVVRLSLAVAVLIAVGLLYRAAAWSLDSPVLRRAARGRLRSKTTLLGLGLIAAATAATLWLLGVRRVDGAAVFFGGMIFLFGGAAVLFLDLIVRDLREMLAARLKPAEPFENGTKPSQHGWRCGPPQPTCVDERRCAAARRPCGSGGFVTPWRPADSPHSGQPR